METLLKNIPVERADEYGTVLSSMGISFTLKKTGQGYDILVAPFQFEKAFNTIDQYQKENQALATKKTFAKKPPIKTFTGIWAALLLLIWHGAIQYSSDPESLIQRFGASAAHILDGELYRTATALMIHADSLHLMGNMVGIALFGTAVCSITGWGVGWLLILLGGMAGNLLNAWFFQWNHVSIGASTAIFCAIGILCGYQFVTKIDLPKGRIRAFLPIGGGLALLAMLGSGKHSDVTAHLFGFFTGMITGGGYTYYIKTVLSTYVQWCCFAVFSIIIAVCWMH